MELRTRISVDKSQFRISYSDPVLFIGSCFASSIGSQLEAGKMPVMINPAGTVYNPVSVINTLKTITSGKLYSPEDLYCHNGTWLSFSHYTDFSSSERHETLQKINDRITSAANFISGAKFLFVTFGTARVFILRKTGEIVSNCHKLPDAMFERKLLTVNEITDIWCQQLDYLQSKNPELKVIFTVSPVRHWKDGAHGNQVSKSVLFLAIEELLKHPSSPGYFPAYEIMMDELRDYRFYESDMLHPSRLAIEYIWEAFSGSFLDEKTMNTYREAAAIVKASLHRISNSSDPKTKIFAESTLAKIEKLEKAIPGIDFSKEKQYFLGFYEF
jgi:hypothetical protein